MTSRMHKTSRRRIGPMPAHTWLSIRVELVEGRGEHYWPRPGRLFAAARSHFYAQLATAIDDAFGRWDRSHLHEFDLADGTRIGMPDPESRTFRVSRPLSNSSMCSTLVTIGHTSAQSTRPALIRVTLSAWFPTPLCHISGGGTSRINTGGLGPARTRNPPYL